MPISEVTVNSLGDLIDKVTPTEPDPKTGRRRDHLNLDGVAADMRRYYS